MTDTSAIRLFCQSSRDLAALNEQASKRARVIQEEKRAAQAVLKEVLLETLTTTGGSSAAHKGYIVARGGETYRVRPREVVPPPPRPSSSDLSVVQKLWEDPQKVRRSLEAFSGLEPAAALVSFLLEASENSRQLPLAERKWKVEVLPLRRKNKEDTGEDDDMPPAAPTGGNVDELVDTLLRAREAHHLVQNETKEARKQIEQKRDEAALQVIPHLQALPSEKKVQKISLRDRDGRSEAFYLRLKPMLKARTKKLTAADYKAALKAAAEDTIRRFCLDAYQLPERGSTLEFCEAFCGTLKEVLGEKEEAARHAITGSATGQRIALDRVRSRAVTEAALGPP